jgi:hypothetical protein
MTSSLITSGMPRPKLKEWEIPRRSWSLWRPHYARRAGRGNSPWTSGPGRKDIPSPEDRVHGKRILHDTGGLRSGLHSVSQALRASEALTTVGTVCAICNW